MMTAIRALSPANARRLAISRQHLAGHDSAASSPGGKRPAKPDAAALLNVIRDLGCLQLDPISVVARSHQLVLFSRLGAYDLAHLDTLLWQERRLFEYWAHAASIVLTEDYPVHRAMMDEYANGSQGGWPQRTRQWMEENRVLRDHILGEIERQGPLPSKYFEDKSQAGWESTGWTGGRNVSRMIDFLWVSGALMVAGRKGGQKQWDLASRCLPDWTPRESWSGQAISRYGAEKAIRALGVARVRDIKQHYIRGRYAHLPKALTELEAEGRIQKVEVKEENGALPGPWYIHRDDLPLLEGIESGDWQPRTTLLSPFDNLMCDRQRTEKLFNYDFRIEIYVPKEKRQYGYYVLSILHGDRLIGRIDPAMDRKQKRLTINAVHAEPGAPASAGKAVAKSIEELAAFLEAKDVVYTERVPDMWRKALG